MPQHLRLCMPAPGRVELQPFDLEDCLPEDHVEGPALASAISPGTELSTAYAHQDPAAPASGSGYAMVFQVENAGSAAAYSRGDVVFCMGAHQSWVRRPAAGCWKVPPGVEPGDAALSRLAGVSWSTVSTTAARPPARVAVTGLGIVGNLAAQILAASGYQVLACDPVAERREHLADTDIELVERLPLEDSPWAGETELVVECSGHEAAALDACKLVRRGGEVVLVGVPWEKRTELPAFDLLHAVFHHYVNLRSGWEWEVPIEPQPFRHGAIRDNIIAAMRWFGDGRLSSARIAKRVNPADCDAVYRDLSERGPGPLTAIFDWTQLEQS